MLVCIFDLMIGNLFCQSLAIWLFNANDVAKLLTFDVKSRKVNICCSVFCGHLSFIAKLCLTELTRLYLCYVLFFATH